MRKRLATTIISVFAFSWFIIAQAYGLPQGQSVETGSATFSQPDANTLIITAADNTVINFNSFDIGANESVSFIQPSSIASVLSRVNGGTLSVIAGILNANGRLFLVNPAGISFTATAQVQAGSFTASTLDISTNNFIKGNYIFERKDGTIYAQVLNAGRINADNIALIANAVNNNGIILAKAGTVSLVSGDKTTVSFDAKGLIHVEVNAQTSAKVFDNNGVSVKDAVANSGTITAREVYMTANTALDVFKNAVNQTGIVRASGIAQEGGVIRLTGSGDIQASGTLDSGAGRVDVETLESVAVNSRLETVGKTSVAAGKDIKVNADITTTSGDLSLLADNDFDGVGRFLQALGTAISTLFSGDITIQASGESTLANINSAGDLNLKRSGAPVNFTQQANSVITTNGSLKINPAATLTAADTVYNVGRDWSNLGNFIPGTSTVRLTGLDAARIFGSNEFYNLVIDTPQKSVGVEPETTQSIINNLVLRGSYGKLLAINSIEPGKQWNILPLGTTDISYISLGNCIKIRGPPLETIHSNSLGNNINCDLGTYWTGQGPSGNWSDPDNWDTGAVPTAFDAVTFDGLVGLYPDKDSYIDVNFGGTVAKLTINGYKGSLTFGRDLTVTGDIAINSGTILNPSGSKITSQYGSIYINTHDQDITIKGGLYAYGNIDIYAGMGNIHVDLPGIFSENGSINLEMTKGNIIYHNGAYTSAPQGQVRLWTCGNIDLRKGEVISKAGGFIQNPDDVTYVSWTGGGGNNNWATAANWSGGVVPNSNIFNVTINLSGATVTTAAAYTIGGLTIGGTNTCQLTLGQTLTTSTAGGDTGAVTINSNGTLNCSNRLLTVGGNLTVNGVLSGTAGVTLSGAAGATISGTGNISNTGTFTVNTGNKSITAGSDLTIAGAIVVTGVTLTNNGTIRHTKTGNAALSGNGGWTQANGSYLYYSGTTITITTRTFNTNSNTIEYNLAGAQTVLATTYYNLIISGGAKTVGGVIAVNGNLTVNSGSLTTAGSAFTVNGATNVPGGTLTFTNNTGAKTMVGLVTVSGGTMNGASTNIVFRGGITQTSGTVSITGTATFNTNSQALSGTISINTVTVTGVTLTNNGTLTIATALTGTGGLTNAATGTLNINFGGAMGITTLTASAVGNTVNYGFAGAQTVFGTNYHNLTLSNSGVKTLQAGTTSIGGNLTLSGTASTATVVGLVISGNLSIGNGTAFTAAGFALTVTGTTTVGSGASGSLTISSNAGAKIFVGLVTVNSGATWNNSGNSPVTFRGGITNSGTFTAGSGVHTFDTNSQALTGTISIPSITVTGAAVILTNNGTLTVTTALAGTGGLTNAATGTLNINFTGAVGIATLTATAAGNTVSYGAAGAQTVFATNYYNLTLSGSGTKTLAAGTTGIANIFTTGGLTVNTTTNSTTVDYNGASQNIAAISYYNLTLSGSGTKTLAAGTTGIANVFTTGGLTVNTTTNSTTVDYNGASQTVADINYYNLTLSGSGTKTLQAGTTTISGNLTLSGTASTSTVGNLAISGNLVIGDGTTFTVASAGSTFTVTGTTTVGAGASGNLTISAATGVKTFTGLVTVNAGGTWNNSGNSPVTFRGGITNSGTFTAGTGIQTFDTNNQALTGTFSISSITVTGAAVTLINNGTLTITTALAGTGGLTNAATGTLNINFTGVVGIATLTATAVGNTVSYGAAGVQTVVATNYYNLTLAGSGTKTLAAGTTGIANTFTTGGLTVDATTNLTTVNYNGASQSVAAINYYNLTLSGSGTKTLAAGITGIANTFTTGGLTVNTTANSTTVDYNGASQSVAPINYYNLTLSGSGTKTLQAGTTGIANTFTTGGLTVDATTNSATVNYNGASQNVAPINYYNLTLSGSGTKTLQAGTTGIANTFTTGGLTVDATTNLTTVNYNGAGQTVATITYYNLTLSGSGAKTMTGVTTVNGDFTASAGSATVALSTIGGNFIVNGCTVTLATNALVVSGNLAVSSGSLTTGNRAFTVNGTTDVSGGTLTFASNNGAKTMVGLVTVSGGTLNGASNNIFFRGGITRTSGSLSITGEATFDTNNQALNGTMSIATVTVTGITLTNNGTLTVSTALSGTGGLTQGAGATLNIGGTSGIATLTATASPNTVDYNGASQTIKATDYYNLTFSGSGIKTLAAGTTGIANTFTTGGLTVDATTNSTTVNYNGAAQNVAAINYYNLTLSGSGTKTLAAGTTGIANTFTTGGLTVDATANTTTVNYNGASQTVAPINYYNLTLSGSGTKTLAAGTTGIANTFTINGLTVDATTNTATVNYNGASQTVASINYYNLTLSGSGTKTLAVGTTGIANTFTTNGLTVDATTNSTTVNYNGASQNVAPINYYNLTLSGSGTKTLAPGTIGIANTFTTGGLTVDATTNSTTVDYNGVTQTVSAIPYGNLLINSTTSATLTGNITISGTFTINSGIFDANGRTVTVTGLTTVGGGVYQASTGTQTFNGGLTVSGGTFSGSTGAVDVNGPVTLSSGTLTAPLGSFTVSGDWIRTGGVFTPGTGTVVFDGAGASILSGSTTFYDLKCVTAGKVLTFTRGTTQTVTHGLTISGTAANPVVINDTGAGVVPQFTLQAGATQNISDVNVTNNDASGGIALVARGTSSLSGTTTNWALGSSGLTFTWTGAVSTDWNTPGNWDLGLVPSAGDTVVIPLTANQPVLAGNTSLETLTINAGATLFTGGNSLTVSGNVVINGTLNAGASTISVSGNITTAQAGTLAGTDPTLSVNGYMGTQSNPIRLNISGTLNLLVSGMQGFVSVSVTGAGNINWQGTIPGFVVSGGALLPHLGQAQIRALLGQGECVLYRSNYPRYLPRFSRTFSPKDLLFTFTPEGLIPIKLHP